MYQPPQTPPPPRPRTLFQSFPDFDRIDRRRASWPAGEDGAPDDGEEGALDDEFFGGSFSAVSKRNFARKYAFDSIFQALQDLHPFEPLQSQHFRKKSV